MSEVYLGNPNLKKANTQIEFTEEQILEFLKCKEDPVYFARNYIKIVSLEETISRLCLLIMVLYLSVCTHFRKN
jgi:hypothetical protein